MPGQIPYQHSQEALQIKSEDVLKCKKSLHFFSLCSVSTSKLLAVSHGS